MSSIFNRVSLVGRLARDPQAFQRESGTSYLITLAVEANYRDQSGKRPVFFIEVQYFMPADSKSTLFDYMKKGVMVGVTGEMRSYVDDKNYTHQYIKLDPNGITFMPTNARHASKDTQEKQAPTGEAQATQAKPAPKQQEEAKPESKVIAKDGDVELTEEDLPF